MATRFGPLHHAKTLMLVGLVALAGCWGNEGNDDVPTLQALEISPSQSSIAAGTSAQFVATAIYSDNRKVDATARVAWTSSEAAVATLGAATGMALAVGPGTAKVGASLGSLSASATLDVTAATVRSIALTPDTARLAAGTAQRFIATGTFTDNTTQALGAEVVWTSSDTGVATVDASGLASAVAAGAANLTAACQSASVCGTVSGTAALAVSNATLVSIAITPGASSIAPGTTQQFVATGTFSDSSTQILSTQVNWTSSAPSTASIDGSSALATSRATGSTDILAARGSVSSPAARLTVTAATLVSITVTSASPSLPAGQTQQFEATGLYSDQSTQDLTALATWASSTAAAATISNAARSSGVATAVAVGTTGITASFGSVTSAVTPLQITTATQVSLAVTPATAFAARADTPRAAVGTSIGRLGQPV